MFIKEIEIWEYILIIINILSVYAYKLYIFVCVLYKRMSGICITYL